MFCVWRGARGLTENEGTLMQVVVVMKVRMVVMVMIVVMVMMVAVVVAVVDINKH